MLAVHVGVLLLVVLAGVLGGILGRVDRLQPLVPSGQDLVSNLWTAVLAAIFEAYVA